MQFEKIHNKGRAQLFKNPYLEMLTKTHPLVIWGMYTPVMICMLYFSGNSLGFSTTRIIFTFLGGMLFWSLFEYIAHRFLFHMVANSGRAKKFVYTLHAITTIIQEISSVCSCRRYQVLFLHLQFSD